MIANQRMQAADQTNYATGDTSNGNSDPGETETSPTNSGGSDNSGGSNNSGSSETTNDSNDNQETSSNGGADTTTTNNDNQSQPTSDGGDNEENTTPQFSIEPLPSEIPDPASLIPTTNEDGTITVTGDQSDLFIMCRFGPDRAGNYIEDIMPMTDYILLCEGNEDFC